MPKEMKSLKVGGRYLETSIKDRHCNCCAKTIVAGKLHSRYYYSSRYGQGSINLCSKCNPITRVEAKEFKLNGEVKNE